MWVARTRYQKQRSAAITIQCFLRAYMARQQYYKVCDVMWCLTFTGWFSLVAIRNNTECKPPIFGCFFAATSLFKASRINIAHVLHFTVHV